MNELGFIVLILHFINIENQREYVTDVDAELARLAIRAIGGIGIRLQKMATPIVKQLTSFINMNQDYITNETIVIFKGILSIIIQKYLHLLTRNFKKIQKSIC